MKGTVVKFDTHKGFGFIRSDHHEKDIFVHISNVNNANKLGPGQSVEFEIKKTAKGRAAVLVIAGRKQPSPCVFFGSLVVVVTLVIALYLGQSMHAVTAYFLGINITTLLIYGYDKAIAGTGKLRVPEWALHTLAITGGTPAALVAQQLFRHKTIKGTFQLMYWVIVLLQGLLITLVIRA